MTTRSRFRVINNNISIPIHTICYNIMVIRTKRRVSLRSIIRILTHQYNRSTGTNIIHHTISTREIISSIHSIPIKDITKVTNICTSTSLITICKIRCFSHGNILSISRQSHHCRCRTTSFLCN